jgi:hypothetical protein
MHLVIIFYWAVSWPKRRSSSVSPAPIHDRSFGFDGIDDPRGGPEMKYRRTRTGYETVTTPIASGGLLLVRAADGY